MARLKYSLALPVSLLYLLLALSSIALERGNFTAEYRRQGKSGMRVRMVREAGDGGEMNGNRDDMSVVKSLRLAVFADPTLHRLLATFHPDDAPAATHKFITTVISAAENILQEALRGSGVQLEVQLVQVGVWAEEEVVPFSGRAMASGTLSGFCQWASVRRPPFEDPTRWHHAMLITGEDMFDSSPNALGVTYVGGLCHPQAGCSVVEGHSFRAAYIIAHELAHSLGLPHDGDHISTQDCPAEGHLMGTELSPVSYTWSTCSRKNLAAIVRNHTCLDAIRAIKRKVEGMNQDNKQKEEESAAHGPQRVVPPELDHNAGGLPGQRFSADEQCRFAFGTDYRAVATTTDVCGYLWCTNGMISRGAHPALPGTPCGQSQVCWAGRCQKEETVSPPHTAAPPNQPPTSRPTIPPFQPNQPPSRPPYRPPSRPSRPPYQPPSRPPYQPPSRPPHQPPSRPPYRPPNRPPFLPPTGQPTRPPHQPSARPPASRPTLPPHFRPEEKHNFPPATVPDEVSSIPVPLRCHILPPFLHRYIECPSSVIIPASPALPPSPLAPLPTQSPATAMRPQPYLPQRDSGNTSAVIKKMETEGADITFNYSTIPLTSSSFRSPGVIKTHDNFKVPPSISQTSPPSSLSNTSSVVPSQTDFHDSSAGVRVEHTARSDEYNINSSANTSHTYELKENNGSSDSAESHPEGLSDIDEPRKGKKQALNSFNTGEKMKMNERMHLSEKRLNSSDSPITKDIHQILSYIEDQNSSNNNNTLDTIMKNKKDEEEKPRDKDEKEKGESADGQKMGLTEETTDVPLSVRAISISGSNLRNSLHNLIYPLLRWMAREEKEGVKEGEKETLKMGDKEGMKDREKEEVKEKDKEGMKEGEKERQENQLSSTSANTSKAVNIFTPTNRPTIFTPAITYPSQENHLKMQSMFDRLAVVNLREGAVEPPTVAATAPRHTRISTYAPCTHSCGGGTQLVTQVCVEVTSPENKVSEEKCDGLPNYHSPYTRPCNTFSCEPPPRWEEGSWGVCSEWCGTGLQQRLVGCVRPLLQELPVPSFTLAAALFLPASTCPTPPPIDVRVCEGPCLPVNCSSPNTTFHPACTHLLPDPPLERDHPFTQPSRNFINNFGRQDLYG